MSISELNILFLFNLFWRTQQMTSITTMLMCVTVRVCVCAGAGREMTLPNAFQTRSQITYSFHHPFCDTTNSRAAKRTQMSESDTDCVAIVPTLVFKPHSLRFRNYLFWKYVTRCLAMPGQERFNVIKALTTIMFVIQVGKYEDCA